MIIEYLIINLLCIKTDSLIEGNYEKNNQF